MIGAVLAIFSASARAAPPLPRIVRVQVAIVRQAESTVLSPEGEFSILPPGGRKTRLHKKSPLTLRPREGGLKLADLPLPSDTRLVPRSGGMRIAGNLYRGPLILRLDPGQTVTVIEDVALEDYLEGVLPYEMDPAWPLEALKAQAVVARTFAYANLGKFKKDGFDLTADTRSQIYRGFGTVADSIRKAVRGTRGEVLGWQGHLLRAYYHSSCGGATENYAAIWGGDPKTVPRPLRGVKDPWCKNSPRARWNVVFNLRDVSTAIQDRHPLGGQLTYLKVSARDSAGFASSILARGGGTEVTFPAVDLRKGLGAAELPSIRIRNILVKKNVVEISGSGSGHGVGLCQWGAKNQAEAGRSYEKILSFYFPGADISLVDQ